MLVWCLRVCVCEKSALWWPTSHPHRLAVYCCVHTAHVQLLQFSSQLAVCGCGVAQSQLAPQRGAVLYIFPFQSVFVCFILLDIPSLLHSFQNSSVSFNSSLFCHAESACRARLSLSLGVSSWLSCISQTQQQFDDLDLDLNLGSRISWHDFSEMLSHVFFSHSQYLDI